MKLIQTKDYLLLIDEEAEIRVDHLFYPMDGKGHITRRSSMYLNVDGCGKIIAYYPLTKEAKELNLPLLPSFEKEVDIEKIANEWFLINNYNKEDFIHSYHIPNYITTKNLFIEGYKAAQSKRKQFSLEDMKKAIEMARTGYGYDGNIDIIAHLDMGGIDNYNNEFKFKSEEEIIQSLSPQQLPKEFIPEQDKPGLFGHVFRINSQGKQELVGVWKFAK